MDYLLDVSDTAVLGWGGFVVIFNLEKCQLTPLYLIRRSDKIAVSIHYSILGNLKIPGVLFNADKRAIKTAASNASCSTAHCAIQDRIAFVGVGLD
jgi:hypothetical protein